MVGMEFSHVCLVYVMPWHIVAMRGDAPGGLWSPHSLNRLIAVLVDVIWAHYDGNEAALPRCTGSCTGSGVTNICFPDSIRSLFLWLW